MFDPNFYEDIVPETDQADEPKDTRAHILTDEEMESWKNGEDEGPVLRRAADVEPEVEPEPEKPVVEPPKVEATSEVTLPTIQAVDPGEYVPVDYSFDVTIYDADGNKPRTVKVSSVEEFDALLEADSNFGNYAALAKAQRAADKMESNSERDLAKWETDKETYDTEAELTNGRLTILNNVANEMAYLAGRGDLPTITKELEEANWSDPEIASQLGVKERIEILQYIEKENAILEKAGLAQNNSPIAAWRAMQLEATKTKAVDERKVAGEARKAAGAKVGGSQPAEATNVPKGIAVGRVNPGGLRDMGVRF